MTSTNLFQLQGQNDHTDTYREQGLISDICKFGWYEWVYERDGSEPFTHMNDIFGLCLGTENN